MYTSTLEITNNPVVKDKVRHAYCGVCYPDGFPTNAFCGHKFSLDSKAVNPKDHAKCVVCLDILKSHIAQHSGFVVSLK